MRKKEYDEKGLGWVANKYDDDGKDKKVIMIILCKRKCVRMEKFCTLRTLHITNTTAER